MKKGDIEMNTESIPLYFRYWGKAEKDGSGYHLLPYHCLDVATSEQVSMCKKLLLKNILQRV
jgi:hypothetical protein